MNNFEKAIRIVLDHEGGYSNHPSDKGGATRYGITEAVARAHAYSGRMDDLSEYAAQQIAKAQYWDVLRLDEISAISYPIALELFDTGFNCGVATAGRFLQRALNSLNRQGKDYHDVEVDGVIGPLTVHALRLLLVARGINGQAVMLKALNCLQGTYYIEISEKRPANEDFVFGWLSNRVSLNGVNA